MSLSVSYNQNFKTGIDTSALKEVTQQIFQRANAKNNDLANFDLTKFNRVSLGTDLYSGKVDTATARQISMNNSGLQINLSNNALASVAFLNTQASKALLANVDGKFTPVVNEITTETKKNFELPTFGQLTETADLGKDKRGSNPFFGSQVANAKKNEEKEEVLNIFA